jgi:hypothetical protein
MKKLLLLAMLISLTSVLTSCQTTKIVLADKMVVRMPAGVAYTSAIDGWFVPDARMLQMMNGMK